ncbi:MAG: chemotaxis protein CheA [Nitrospinae bacterium]|nr:chemotaxis protein CheA [Nitrospinota bacterium]
MTVEMEEMMDPEVLKEYLAEVFESLDGLDERFVALEANPQDVKIIDSIFRPVHSIKGSSAFFGLNHVKSFAHKLENLLDDLRKGDKSVTPVITDNLLKGADFLRAMFKRVVEGNTIYELTPEEKSFIDGLEERIAVKAETGAEEATNAEFHLQRMGRTIENAKKTGSAGTDFLKELSDDLAAVMRLAGSTFSVGAEPTPPEAGKLQQEGEVPVPKVEKLGEILVSSGKVDRSKMTDAMRNKMEGEKLGEVLIREGLATREVIKDAMAAQTRQAEDAAKAGASVKKTMRIEEEKVDEFMRQIGELIIISETLNYLEKRLDVLPGASAVSKEFKNANMAFSEATYRLQQGLSEVRKVSIRGLYQKIPRIVRDTASLIGKSANVDLIGEDLLLDKSLLEKLESPVIHMVRNAIDHGVETPDKREAAGKPRTGRITVSASIADDNLFLTLKDDGAGLSRARILRKVVGKGMLTPQAGELLSDKEVFDFIFAPGFSTAEEVTDISGRGVGMDVVKSALVEVKGKIDVQSKEGRGTTFTITLPITTTLVTINGLVVAVGKLRFILPVEDVRESIKPAEGEIFTVKGEREMVNIRGNLYPLVRLYEKYNIETGVKNPVDGVGIIIEKERNRCCLVADAIVEQQNVVMKDLGGPFRRVKSIMGGAILGDGAIGLLINVDRFMEGA